MRAGNYIVNTIVNNANFNGNCFRVAIIHSISDFQVQKEIGVVIEHNCFIETPVKRLQKGSFTKSVITQNDSYVLFRVTGEVNCCNPFELSKVLHF